MISKQMVAWGESGSSIREIAAYGERRAAEIGAENVYNFSIGSPSIDPPDCVHAAIEHLLHTVPPTQLHAYAPAPGMASVREKVAAYLTDTFGEAYRAQDIYMTDGASSALAILTRALMGPGDEAIVFAPYFPEYAVYAEAAGGSVRVVPCRADTFALDLDALAAAVTEKTALLILNSPNNPSGVVVSRPELEALAALLREKQARYGHPIYIIADEPTGNIDPERSREILEMLIKIHRMDKTVIVVTHEKHLVEEFDERVVTISKGRVVGDTKGSFGKNTGKEG